jgi:hypothetical protein
LHFICCATDGDLDAFGSHLRELRGLGINTLVVEVNYNYDFQSHPELRGRANPITQEGARRFSALARAQGMRVIPLFNCLGHQSDHENKPLPLLACYPELDLVPGEMPGGDRRHPRAWDPMNPKVNAIIFPLLDEIIDGFQAKDLHVGMDEVFFLGDDASPSTRGRDPGELFAQAVNDLYGHVVTKRGLRMLMWGDRLIDGAAAGFHAWESSHNGTFSAADRLPKDIIVCPWHYSLRATYPSIPALLEKGFTVLPASWNEPKAVRALIDYALELQSPRLLGHLFTTWNGYVAEVVANTVMRDGVHYLRAMSGVTNSIKGALP